MVTEQELFDKVCQGLASQNWQQCYDNGCRYEYNGLRCAIGYLIDKEEYEAKNCVHLHDVMGTVTGNSHISNYIAEKYGREHIMFLKELQLRHDGNSNPEDMKNSYKIYAEKHGLHWGDYDIS